MSRLMGGIVALVAITGVLAPREVLASFHLWRIEQIYSNASGTVQFINLSDPSDGENLVGGHTVTTNSGHTFTFPSNLGTDSTANHHLLLATPGYIALPGVPTADFNLGANNFFSAAGDGLHFAGVNDVVFSAGQVPTDGLHSLLVNRSGTPTTSAVNSATNFAGASNQIPPWENQDNRFDVNQSGGVAPIDALQIINELLANGVHSLVAPAGANVPPPFVDVNGDNLVSPLDGLQVINQLLPQSLSATSQSFSAMSLAMPMVFIPEPTSGVLMFLGAILAVASIKTRTQRCVDHRAPDTRNLALPTEGSSELPEASWNEGLLW